MTILPAGSFKTSDYRKSIPDWVKIVCAIRALDKIGPIDPKHYCITPCACMERDGVLDFDCPNCKTVRPDLIQWVRSLRFDHRPPLQDRPYDTEKGDFDPPQNHPDFIEAIPSKEHDERTFGTGATTLNSDAHNRAHGRRLRDKEAQHQLKLACKRGDPEAIAKLLHVEKPKREKRRWPKRPMRRRAA